MSEFVFTEKQQQILKEVKYGLTNKYKEICLYGGRRSGKTFLLLDILIQRALVAPASKHVICRNTYSTIYASIWNDTIQNQMMQIDKYQKIFEKCKFNKNNLSITFPNDSVIYLKGLDNTEKSLGTEFATIYFNECSEIPYQKLEVASGLASKREIIIQDKVLGPLPTIKMYDFNPPYKTHWTYKYFIEHVNPETQEQRKKEEIDKIFIERLNPIDNVNNIDQDYINVELKSRGADYAKRFAEGEFLEYKQNAVFSWEDIQTLKNHDYNDLTLRALLVKASINMIVIGVDPAVSTNEKSDLTGISVCGYSQQNDMYFIIEDMSGKYTPEQTAKEVVEIALKWQTQNVVIEVNQGGDYLSSILNLKAKEYGTYLTIEEVRGNSFKNFDEANVFQNPKLKRATAVKALIAQNKIKQIDSFFNSKKNLLENLNQEMLEYTGVGKSPDRMDAMVYAIIFLMQQNANKNHNFNTFLTKENTQEFLRLLKDD